MFYTDDVTAIGHHLRVLFPTSTDYNDLEKDILKLAATPDLDPHPHPVH